MRKRSTLCAALLVSLLSIFLAGNALAQGLQKVSFRYSWILYGHAPAYYYAKELGIFEKEGLDVTILTGTGSGTNVKLMGAGENNFGEADYATMMLGIARGVPVVGVYGILQTHPMSVATRADLGVTKPADLVGKSIAVAAGGGDQAILPAFLAANNLTGKVKVVQLSSGGAKREALLQSKVDGIVAYVNEQVPQIEAAGVKLNVLKFSDYGAPLLGVGIMVNTKTPPDKDVTQRFLRAVSRGFEAAMKNPEAAVDAALRAFPERKRETTLKELSASFPLFHTKNTQGKPLGWMDKSDWEKAEEIMATHGGMEKRLPMERFYTNEYISAKQ